jgi:hypothetical protein
VGVDDVREIPLVEMMLRESPVPETSHFVADPRGFDLGDRVVHLNGQEHDVLHVL